jgi:hypothetical protein
MISSSFWGVPILLWAMLWAMLVSSPRVSLKYLEYRSGV